ncbi:MAG TPA: hypothetical protein DD379_05315, partial [Cyanobacteria bacterium UBA11162]|nr:hypothetical protein [Cyanobacteria bacterium UBA11162]
MATGDFSIDFVAAAPFSYNHLTGGGAYDDRTVGVSKDIVESLEGGDFACGDIVTYFLAITVDEDGDLNQTLELDVSFLADTTGQSGVAIGDIVFVGVNRGTIQDLIAGENTVDDGNIEDGGSTATLVYENLTGPLFTSGSVLEGTIEVNDLDAGERVIIRVDVKLFCDPGSNPTGNLQGDLQDIRLVPSPDGQVSTGSAVPGGNQTVPFKQIGDIAFPALDIQKTVRLAGTSNPFVETLTISGGQTVEYRYVVTNSDGNPNTEEAPLYNVVVIDDNGTPGDMSDDFQVTLSGLTDIDGDGQADDLAAGATATGTAQVTLSTNGTVVNTATATGADSIVQPMTLTDSDTATVIVQGTPDINVTKTANVESVDSAGDIITYTYTVSNGGTVPLTGVTLIDDNYTPGDPGNDFNPTRGADQVGDNDNILEVGEIWTYTATHTVTQPEIDAGVDLVNTATADSNETGPETAIETVEVIQNPDIEI